MASADRCIRVYQELATHYDARGEAQVRDRFLVLAADAATAASRAEEAERLRNRLLELNPHHMLRPYSSWSQALQSQDVKSYIEGLRRTYPPSSAENLLESVRGMQDEERVPRPLPSAELEVTLPYKPAGTDTTPSPSVPLPAVGAPAARSTPAVPPTARTAPIPFAQPAPAPGNGPPRSRTVVAAPAPIVSAPTANAQPPAGSWVAATLFYVVLLAGLALAAYTFIQPFYPISQRLP